jgi:hypothetical protein
LSGVALSKVWNEKNPKKIANFFLPGEALTGQRPPVSKSQVVAFFT